MKALLAACFVVALAAPALAQPSEGIAFRPFVMVIGQRFAAEETFTAVFDDPTQVMFGGGLSVTQGDQFYLELSASRFKKTGQRAFFSNGRSFGLGIPLTATLTPFEMSAGYRFHRNPAPARGRAPVRPARPARFIPYLGAGVGLYRYQETSDFAQTGDDLDTQHVGGIAEGGLEVRLHRWIGVAVDVRYTYVPGILGDGGVSKEAGETNLGGIAARFKLVVGR
jgi:hypothetical protein